MIYREEIDAKANEFKIHSSNVQRDYVYGWILLGIYSVSELKNHFVLKGGNCLRKAYFENTRYSSDLDFSVARPISEKVIKSELLKVCAFVEENAGIRFHNNRTLVRQIMQIDQDRTVQEARIYFQDFYGIESSIILKVKLDITEYEKIYLPIQSRKIIHPYSDSDEFTTEIKCLKLEELFASKLKCLLQRRQSNDLYDYVFHLIFSTSGLEINKKEIATTFLRMTIFGRSPGVAKGLLVDLPFAVLKSAWSKYVTCPISSMINADVAIDTFKKDMEAVFGIQPTSGGDYSFFPSKYRNIIMNGAEDLTMLKLKYKGYERFVEPYSLAFKTRRDGVSKEYFYGYDTSGGSSKPGIKAFVRENIEGIDNTNIQFDPRYEVELSKSVEFNNNSYFSGPFKGRSSRLPSIKRRK